MAAAAMVGGRAVRTKFASEEANGVEHNDVPAGRAWYLP
jgi:hypothetical protein